MIVVAGLSHRTAPIAVRERLAMAEPERTALLKAAIEQPNIDEAMLVSTCNRVELVVAGSAETTPESLVRQAEQVLSLRAPDVRRFLYAHCARDGVRHLFRVASSLDSLVLGEPQILGQLKQGFEAARSARTLGSVLHRVIPRAIRAAKRVRTETTIGTGQVSVPTVAVDLTTQIFGQLAGRHALLVGSGEMAEAVARLLRHAGAKLIVVGRTFEKAQELARLVDGQARPWDQLRASVAEADVVVASTSAPGFVIDYEMVESSRKARRGRSSFFIDLAVPRDVDPTVEQLDSVFLYNIDDLSKVVAESLSSRQREAERAERIVEEETDDYERWTERAQVTPTIVALRRHVAAVLEAELERTELRKLRHLSAEDRRSLSKMIEAAVNKLMHTPTVRLRQAASEGLRTEQLVSALEELFPLAQPLEDEDLASLGEDTEAGLSSLPRQRSVGSIQR